MKAKRILALTLVVLMLASVMNVTVFADTTVNSADEFPDALENGENGQTITLGGDIDPNDLLNEDESVAQIGDVEYATLEEAVKAAKDGDTIKVINDFKIESMVVVDKAITLDLNGCTVSSAFNGSSTTNHIYAISNENDMVIMDSVGNGSINSRGIYNNGKLTLESGTINSIDGNGGYAVNNKGGSTFIMNGGKVATTYEDDYQSSSGGYDATPVNVSANSTATLNGGKIVNVCDFTFAVGTSGTLIIPENSTIEIIGTHGAIAVQGGTTTIDAGTFTIPEDEYARTDNVIYVSAGAVEINGGTFVGDSDTASGGTCVCDVVGTATIKGGSFSGSSGGDVCGTTGTTIKGGTFENLTEKQHVEVGATIVNGGKTYIKTESGELVEKAPGAVTVNGVDYETLEEAVKAAKDGDTIVLAQDVTISEKLLVKGDITIDGNGKTLTYTGSDRAIDVEYDAEGDSDITIKNLTVDCTASYCQRGINYNDNGSLTLDNVTVKGKNITYALNLPGSSDNAVVTIDNSSFTGNIAMNIWGENCEIIANNSVFTAVDNSEVEGYCAVKLNNDSETSAEGTVVTINGGAINVEGSYAADTEAISNATSTGKFVISDTTKVNGETREMVAVIKYADNHYSFTSLQDAISKAVETNAESVTLIKNIELSETITVPAGAKVALDLNGKKITAVDKKTGNASYEVFYNYGELTVIGNGTVELTAETDRGWNASSSIFHNRGGVLTIENGTFTHKGGTSMAYVVDNNANSYGDATTNIKGGTLTTSYIGIRNRMDTYGANGGGNGIATLNITDGTITGKYAVWGQVASAGVKGAINISGGTLKCAEGKQALLVDTDDTGEIKTAVSGGTFSSAVLEEYCAEGYVPAENGDGTYGVKVEEAVELFNLTGSNIELGNSLGMNFAFNKTDIGDDTTGYYVKIVREYADGTIDTVKVLPENWEDRSSVWTVKYDNIAAKEMTDKITVTVYNEDGAVSNPWVDSVESYVLRMVPKESTKYELKVMLSNMLVYGAEAQKAFGYKTDDLADADVDSQYVTVEDGTYENKMAEEGGSYHNGSALDLESRIDFMMAFKPAMVDNFTKAVITFKDHYGVNRELVVNAEDFEYRASGNVSIPVLRINNLVVADGRQLVTCKIYNGDTLLTTVTDNMESYVARKKDDATYGGVLRAVMRFSDSAYTYFRSIEEK